MNASRGLSGWLAALALAMALAPVRAEMLEPDLPPEDSAVAGPEVDGIALRASNNNPITARRRALRQDVSTLLDHLPESLDALIAQLPPAEKEALGASALEQLQGIYRDARREAAAMRDTVSQRMYGSALAGLETRFPVIRDGMFTAIYQLQAFRHGHDPERFKAFVQRKIDVQAAIDAQKANASRARRAVLAQYEQQLSGNLELTDLNAIYDSVKARQVDSRRDVITVDHAANTASAAYLYTVKISDFKPAPTLAPRAVAVVPTPRIEPIAPEAVSTPIPTPRRPRQPAQTQPRALLSASALSRLVDTVTETWRKASDGVSAYAQQVAQSITAWSERRGLDERLTSALVWTESHFKSTAGSWAACVGLGQLSSAIAKGYGVTDRRDINQNLKGTTGFLRDLMNAFATSDERAYTAGLYAAASTRVHRAQQNGRDKDAAIAEAFDSIWPRIPAGMKDAVAAYNAGQGAVTRYGGYDRLPLPLRPSDRVRVRVGDPAADALCAERARTVDQDNSYCQTKDHVRQVYRRYLTIYVETAPTRTADVPVLSNAAFAAL